MVNQLLGTSSPSKRRTIPFFYLRIITIIFAILLFHSNTYAIENDKDSGKDKVSTSAPATTAIIRGQVFDESGNPVAGANILLKTERSAEVLNLVTDAEGVFHFPPLTTGRYQIFSLANGYTPLTQQLLLAAGKELNLQFVMSVAHLENGENHSNKNSSPNSEVIELRSKLAETTAQVEKLNSLVAELQAKVSTTPTTANPVLAIAASHPQDPQNENRSSANSLYGTPQNEQKPDDANNIDKLIRPKLEGGNFAGAKGLFKNERVKIGGYADFRFFTRGIDDGVEIQENVDENNPSMTDQANFKRSGFTNPRLVLAIAASLTPKIIFNSEIEYEFAAHEIEIEQCYLEYRFNPKLNLRAGIITMPLGRFNIFHDSNLQDISTRPLASTFIIPSTYKDTGIGILGEFNIGKRSRLSYEGYVVNGLRSDEGGEIVREAGLFEARDNISFFDNNPQKSVVGRLMFSPIPGIEAGISGYRGKHDNRGKYDLSIFAFDFKVEQGAFQVLGQYNRAALGRDPEDDSELAAKQFLLSLPKGDYANSFDFLDENINEPIFDKAARSSDGFYVEARYRFRPKWLRERTTEDASIAPVFRFDQVNLDRSYPNFKFPLNQRRYSMGLSLRPTEPVVFNFTYNFNRKPDIFLRLNDGRPFPPYFTNLGANSFTFGISYAF